MEGVKEAIILLKQYGTPVFASAIKGAKFMAFSKIGGSVAMVLIALLGLKFLWKKFGEGDPQFLIGLVAGILILFSVILGIDGIYELVSLDYQAYKMMLLK